MRPLLLFFSFWATTACYGQYVYAYDYQCGTSVCATSTAEDYNTGEVLVEDDAVLYGPNLSVF